MRVRLRFLAAFTAVALYAGTLGAQSMGMGMGMAYEWMRHAFYRTVLNAPLTNAGWTPGTWDTPTVSAPTYEWYGVDQDGSGGISWPGTAAGTIGDVTSPVCNAGACWTGKAFDGTNDYIDASTEWGDPEAQDFTVCTVTFMTALPATRNTVVSKRNVGSDGWTLYQSNTGSLRFYLDSGAVALDRGSVAAITNRWVFFCGVRDVGGNVAVYVEGTLQGATADTTTSIDVGEVVSIGSEYATHVSKLSGYTAWIGIWKGATAPVTEAALDAINSRVWALDPTVGPNLVHDRNSVGCGEDASGYWQCTGQDAPVLEPDGVNIRGAETQYCLNSLDWSAHTDVGTCTVTTNTTSGAWSIYNGSAEADTLDDNDGAAYEGRRIVAETTYTGAYTASATVAAGTNTGASIVIASDGTGSKTCTYTGLDNLATATTSGGSILCRGGAACTASNAYPGTMARLVCTTTIGAVPTATTADLLVGDAAADTGTIIASAGGAWRLAYAGRGSIAAGVAAALVADDVRVSSVAGWPTTSGCVSATYTPDMADVPSNSYLLDTSTRGTTSGLFFQRTSTETLNCSLYSGAVQVASAGSAALTWTPATGYDCKCCWWGTTLLRVYRDGVSVATDTTISAPLPGHTTYRVGYSGVGEEARGSIRALLVQR